MADRTGMRRRTFLTLPALLMAGVGAEAAFKDMPTGRSSAGRELGARVKIGAFVHLSGSQEQDPLAAADLAALEKAVGRQLDIVHYFFDWGRPFTEAVSENLSARNLMLSWKPSGDVVRAIPTGGHDSYIAEFARAAKAHRRPVYLRFAWEMNGAWMDYSAAGGGPDPLTYITAWQHVVRMFREAGAGNVHFIWCPNESDSPNQAGNHLENYWPGSEWVDVLGFDAYNWSSLLPRRGDGSWRPFRDLVHAPYQRLSQLDSSKPVWLCEWGTTEAHHPPDPAGVSKADWLLDAGRVTDFPRLEALVYFSTYDHQMQRDWRLNSSKDALKAFGKAFPDQSAGSSRNTAEAGPAGRIPNTPLWSSP